MPSPPPHLEEDTQIEGGPDHHPTSTQTEEESGYHQSLLLLQDNNQARAQLEYELIQEAQKLAERYEHKWGKQARRHTRCWVQMIDQTDAILQEMLSQACPMEAVKLLTLCVSVAVPFCYISEVWTIATQQDKSHPTASEPDPDPHGPLVPGPSRGLTPPPGTSPLLVSSLPDVPLSGIPLVGHPFLVS